MESEKVKEIKKAIEYNSVSEFMNRLPYADEFNKLKMVSFDDILTLINELESENEKIKQSAKNLAFVNEKVIDENQKLKDRIAELENTIKNNLQYAKGYGDGVKATVEVAYPKKLNEFAERLKEKGQKSFINVGGLTASAKSVTLHDIDKTLKEFIEC